ncbi:MAG: hypothetical protein ABSE68_00860 [Minisyncoccia bacterium]
MKTKRKKIILSALIVLSAGALSGYLVLSPADPAPKDTVVADANAVANSIDSSLNFTIKPLENLTNKFTDQALSDFMSKNGDAVKSGNTKIAKALPDPNDIQTIISNLIDEQNKKVVVTDSDILVNNDDSKEMQRFYLVFVNSLIQNSFNSSSSDYSEGLSATQYFSRTASQLKNAADVITLVKVPPSWKDIHKQIISFFRSQENVFESLAAGEDDPLRFMIASNQILTQEVDKSFNVIKNSVNKRIKDEGLI